MKYIVAHNGPRDGYHVSRALAERKRLQTLVTDFCAPSWLKHFKFGLSDFANRRALSLGPKETNLNLDLFLLQQIVKRLYRGPKLYEFIDSALGRRAAKITRSEKGAGLLLYSGYALEAFEAASPEQPKILFYYHPHNDMVREILAEDSNLYSQFRDFEEIDGDLQSKYMYNRRNKELNLADFVVCASSFTKRSLVFSGLPEEKIRVVAYGSDSSKRIVNTSRKKRFLFVGQGIQRKGLHHLFEAWKRANLKDAELDVVCYHRDKRIQIPDTNNVRIHGYLSRQELEDKFNEASFFVLPSLVEGFGLVYLEALAAGCMCVGTENTGLPDLNCEESSIITKAGCPQALCDALVQCDNAYRAGIDHLRIAELSRLRSWSRFHDELNRALDEFESTTRQ